VRVYRQVGALVTLVGQEENSTIGTNECKKQLVWANGWKKTH